MSPLCLSRKMRAQFSKGDNVELMGAGSTTVSHFPTTLLPAPSIDRGVVLVERRTGGSDGADLMEEHVKLSRVRPAPSHDVHRRFGVGDDVDAYRKNDGCWVRGTVSEILEDSRYLVELYGNEGERTEASEFNLRIHRQWDNGSWIPHLEMQDDSSETAEKDSKLKVKIKFSGRKAPENFKKDSMVEIKKVEEGYKSTWYPARVVDYIGNDTFTVEYQRLEAQNELRSFREVTASEYIRPPPPQCTKVSRFKVLDEVDAWHMEGWRLGTVSRVLHGWKYVVCFSSSNVKMEFHHLDLRAHQHWINGIWVHGSQKKLKLQSRTGKGKRKCTSKEFDVTEGGEEKKAKIQFREGMKVEVRSDEEGFEGAWYTAVITNKARDNKYIVEYQTLKTDDEKELLKDEAEASDIRQIPPPVYRAYPFDLLEYVDAWYNEGWWLGQIYHVLTDMRYVVYFRTTEEYLEFGHLDLRPHKKWINGNWIAASKVA